MNSQAVGSGTQELTPRSTFVRRVRGTGGTDRAVKIPRDSASKGLQLGALACLLDCNGKQQQLFLGPEGVSMKPLSGAQLVQFISSETPLGMVMSGKSEGEEVSIQIATIR